MAEFEFTQTQRELLNLLWDTKVEGKAGRRIQNPNGSYRFEYVKRLMRPIDFAQEGEFTLKLHEKKPDAPLSPYFINLREMPQSLLTKVAEAIAEATRNTFCEIDFCAGIPSAGIPIADEYDQVTCIPHQDIFSKAEDGSGRKIVATPNAPQQGRDRFRKVLIIDDLVTEADTKFEAAEVAASLGYEVAGIAVLVDRQQGGWEQLAAKGFKVYAPLLVSQVFEYYFRTNRIDQAKYKECMNYLNDARLKSGLPKLELATA